MADSLESANTVGFWNSTTRSENKTMSGSCFITTSGEKATTFNLKDLSVTGYTKSYWDAEAGEWVAGCFLGEFVMSVLGPTGAPTATYYWADFTQGYDEKEYDERKEPGWYDVDGNPIDTTQAACTFNAGQSFWILGKGLKLQSMGTVNPNEIQFKTREVNKTACGNGTPAPVGLGELTVSGYTKSYWDAEAGEWVAGCFMGEFVMSVLGPTGAPTATYYWADFTQGYDEKEYDERKEPGWYDVDGVLIDYKLPECTFAAGQGFWILGNGKTINIPAPKALN